ncbi:hypothetical protein EYF80_043297 [Liparis tanakae]|uniref:Uncharacterized protein n=1 Tax=Liparis tanakae TaxID=230148 RepID=A0A4Z2FZ10_9TELE|nr:hypothetical protein EYF80_043297 [Liparis tanakae]
MHVFTHRAFTKIKSASEKEEEEQEEEEEEPVIWRLEQQPSIVDAAIRWPPVLQSSTIRVEAASLRPAVRKKSVSEGQRPARPRDTPRAHAPKGH